MKTNKPPVTVVELGPEDMPITIEYIDEETGEEIRRDVISEPGVLKVPGFFPRKVTVRSIWPDVIVINTSTGAEFEEPTTSRPPRELRVWSIGPDEEASDATGRP